VAPPPSPTLAASSGCSCAVVARFGVWCSAEKEEMRALGLEKKGRAKAKRPPWSTAGAAVAPSGEDRERRK
jgi:hypothetical protein